MIGLERDIDMMGYWSAMLHLGPAPPGWAGFFGSTWHLLLENVWLKLTKIEWSTETFRIYLKLHDFTWI